MKDKGELMTMKKSAVALGLFDGLHKGHKAVIEKMISSCGKTLMPTVFTFDFFKNGERLLLSSDKEKLLYNMGVKEIYSPKFDEIKNLSPDEFIKEILIEKMNAKKLFCGENFTFGKDKKGNAFYLKEKSENYGIETVIIPTVDINGKEISSTLIKSLIKSGDISLANDFLGREYSFTLKIEEGRKLGRELGFRTINQKLPDFLCEIKKGVYAVRVVIEENEYKGVCNIGVKPTVTDRNERFSETHIFDFNEDVYGKNAEIFLVDFIREEKKFLSEEELKMQIKADKETALNIFQETERKK